MHRVRVFTAGGTIDKQYFDDKGDYEIGQPLIADILREAAVTVPFAVEELMRKDSLHMDDADRALIRERVLAADEARVIVTHGTDTMADTARELADTAGKTVVLTGALYPARFRDSDAVFNIGMAFGAVQVLPAGTWIVMNGRVFDGCKVHKNREHNRFEEV